MLPHEKSSLCPFLHVDDGLENLVALGDCFLVQTVTLGDLMVEGFLAADTHVLGLLAQPVNELSLSIVLDVFSELDLRLFLEVGDQCLSDVGLGEFLSEWFLGHR